MVPVKRQLSGCGSIAPRQPAAAECRPAEDRIKASLSGVLVEPAEPCRREAGRIRIDEPPGWPALPPPPVPTLQ